MRGLPAAYWSQYWDDWLLDAYLARQGRQDIHRLRGIDRPLTKFEKLLFYRAIQQQIGDENVPLPGPSDD